jgi:hypothetical protein
MNHGQLNMESPAYSVPVPALDVEGELFYSVSPSEGAKIWIQRVLYDSAPQINGMLRCFSGVEEQVRVRFAEQIFLFEFFASDVDFYASNRHYNFSGCNKLSNQRSDQQSNDS